MKFSRCNWLMSVSVPFIMVIALAGCGNHNEATTEQTEQTSELNSQMIEAISNDNTKRIQDLINRGAEIDISNDTGFLPIHVAAREGDSGLVNDLLENGAPANSYTRPRTTIRTSYEIVGITPLHVAAQHGHSDVVEVLIKNGANINVKPNRGLYKGHTPLYEAAYRNRNHVVKQLLEAGAEVNVKVGGYPPVDYAKQLGHTDIYHQLTAKGATVSDSIRVEPLHSAVLKNQVSEVRKLVRGGEPVDAKPAEGPLKGWTPLHLSAQKGHSDIVKFLLTQGAEVDSLGPGRETPLYNASFHGHLTTTNVLLENGADPDNKTNYGFTPLVASAHRGHPNIIRSLLKAGATINYQVKGWTPLHYAVKYGHEKAVRVLLNKKADRDLRNNRGQTPLELSIKMNRTDITEILRSD